MKIRCEYCNNYLDDSEEKCPSCGAPNANYKRVGNQVPTTIEELQQWYSEHNLPPAETTRFFIGIDYKEPKAFGIYKDTNTGKFIVYKNKDTGERAIRYEGNDEKYAVNELYLKLKEEIVNQKSINVSKGSRLVAPNRRSNDWVGVLVFLFLIVFFVTVFYSSFVSSSNRTSKGYYYINDSEYYYGGGNWFVFENDEWNSTSEPEHTGDIGDYYQGDYYYSSSDYTDIRDSSVYDSDWDNTSSSSSSWESSSSSSSSDDWDYDSDWDSGDSWDSGGSDWGSDW